MQTLVSILLRFCTVDTLCAVAARIISIILKWASGKDNAKWDKAKLIVKKVKIWCSLFDQVYDDDSMTEEEEQLVADMIKEETSVDKIVVIIKKSAAKTAEK